MIFQGEICSFTLALVKEKNMQLIFNMAFCSKFQVLFQIPDFTTVSENSRPGNVNYKIRSFSGGVGRES